MNLIWVLLDSVIHQILHAFGVLFFFFFLIASKSSLQVNDDVDVYLSLWNSAWNPSNDIHALPKKNLFIQNLIKSLVHMDYH
jgi:hypothetical protein